MIEIERKFLIRTDGWRATADHGTVIRQGYLAIGEPTVRVRSKGDKAFLTIKAQKEKATRHEFEYEIPMADATAMLNNHCAKPPLDKTRYLVRHDRHVWEIDVFSGVNAGLILAEVELERVDETVTLPAWAGPEVTDDPRFFNAYIAQRPFSGWRISYAELLQSLSPA